MQFLAEFGIPLLSIETIVCSTLSTWNVFRQNPSIKDSRKNKSKKNLVQVFTIGLCVLKSHHKDTKNI